MSPNYANHHGFDLWLPTFGCHLREFLKQLLYKVWDEEADFNGKRPFGYSSWQSEIYEVLVREGYISGNFDAEGYLNDYDKRAGDEFIKNLIKAM